MVALTDQAGALARVQKALAARWPESTMEPSLDRMRALVDLLGDPQAASPAVHLTGTNGKTSTARMVDALLRAFGLRTGRYTSPHLESVTERICVDGEPLAPDRFAGVYDEVAPYAELVDAAQPHPLSFFEVLTGMAFAAFADAPVDASVIEVGLGGRWDATNVVDAAVSVVTPVGLDHMAYLGDTLGQIGAEKAGIVKPGALTVLAQQPVEAAEPVLRRCAEVGATVAREGLEFGVLARQVAVGGQLVAVRGLSGDYPDLLLPLYGAHQAGNAACALAAVEAFLGRDEPLDVDTVREAFATVRSPGRLEPVRSGPTVLLDGAHNPAAATALVAALEESFAFRRLVGVVAVLADKDAAGLLSVLEPVLDHVVVTQSSSPRAMPADRLAAVAVETFGADRVDVEPRLDDALDAGVRLAEEEPGDVGDAGIGVLVTGSIATVGQARHLLQGPAS
jgi:dihydrofolate synthase/folylpolyglutamate synthase